MKTLLIVKSVVEAPTGLLLLVSPSTLVWLPFGLILGLLAYDWAVVGVLLTARFDEGVSGILLWPGILLHAGLTLWSIRELRTAHS
jgi:hypothetical protein